MNKTNIPSILINFLNYLSIKNYSKTTISIYTYDLIEFFKFIKFFKKIRVEIKDFSYVIVMNIKSEDIESYLYFLSDVKENITATRYRKSCEIKLFFKWLIKYYPAFENPADNLLTLQNIERIPKYLTLKQSKQIQSIFNEKNSNFPLRNNTIITLFLSSGIRLSELINLNVGDMDFENNSMLIRHGKGNKTRKAYFNEHCKKILLEYFNSTQNKIIDLNEPFFKSKQGKRFSRRSVEVICENAFRLMGIQNKKYTTHSLRHTCATTIYQSTPNILLIKEILGHSSINSTKIYTHTNNDTIRKAIESNPLSNFEPSNKIKSVA